MCQQVEPFDPKTLEDAKALVNYHCKCITDLKKTVVNQKIKECIKTLEDLVKDGTKKFQLVKYSVPKLETTTLKNGGTVGLFFEKLERDLDLPEPGIFADGEYLDLLSKYMEIASIQRSVETVADNIESVMENIEKLLYYQEETE